MTLNENNLEKRFEMVSTSQGSIQSLSFFCLHYKAYHKKIAHIWLRSLQKAKISHRLTLIYLANDIVQNAKRKNALSFIEDFKSILKDTIPYLKDEKIKKSVDRVFSIWQDRSIYDVKFINELKSLLNNTGKNKSGNESTVSKANNAGDSQKSIKQGDKTNDITEILNKLSDIERNYEELRLIDDNIIDRLESGTISKSASSPNTKADLKKFVSCVESEIDETTKLAKIIDESMIDQKQLLKESEGQLVMYSSQLDYITKLRDELI